MQKDKPYQLGARDISKGGVLQGHINAVKLAQLPKQPHQYVFYQV